MSETASRPLGPWSWMVGFVACGMANAVSAAVMLGAPADARVSFHAFDLLHFVGLGLAATAVAWAVRRATVRRHADVLATTTLAVVVGLGVLPLDLLGPSVRIFGTMALAPVLAVATALLVPAAELAGRVWGRSRLRLFILVLPAITGPVNLTIFTHLHPGAHLFLAWGTAAVLAGALRDQSVPHLRPRVARIATAVLALASLIAMVLPMPPRGAALMSQVSGSVLYPWLSRIHAARVRRWLPDPMPEGPWFRPRADAPPVPATVPAPNPAPNVVILVSIDAMRADLLTDPELEVHVPRLAALRDSGVFFSHAYAPSNRTVPSLSALFTGKHYSQLYWSEMQSDRGVEIWPHEDESVRFPELLSDAGVRTVTYAAAYWLVNEFGIVRGFDDEDFIEAKNNIAPPQGSRWASAAEVVKRLKKRLARVAKAPTKPMFFFIHLLEPHYPYNQGRSESDDTFSRYLAEVAVVDAQLGALLDDLASKKMLDRTAIVIVSDHGEAFGEHATNKHGSTLYEEVMRIPLLVVAPGVAPRVVDTPVSLIDVGPTILDMFGLETPGDFMGESLVPWLVGEHPAPTRPVAFEARPKQGMVFTDGMKVIRDLRYGLLEAYDLHADPEELDNLYRGFGSSLDEYFGPLAAFFHVHALELSGYEIPNR